MTNTQSIAIDGTGFRLGGKPFLFQGLSFFNAIFNSSFNESAESRARWLAKFRDNGISVLRVFGQWDCGKGWVDALPTSTLYEPDGCLRQEPLGRLKGIAQAADAHDMVIELSIFGYHSNVRLSRASRAAALQELTPEMTPYRNLIFQIWNEDSEDVLGHLETIKAIDPERLVTNSPGFADNLGDEAQNSALYLLTPHTVRRGEFWVEAPKQIAMLLEQYGKPVVDDEPARAGTGRYSGRTQEAPTTPAQHITHIVGTQGAGGHSTYHHNMFQYGYGHPETPPDGIPDPDFSPFHRQVIDHLRQSHTKWAERNECEQV